MNEEETVAIIFLLCSLRIPSESQMRKTRIIRLVNHSHNSHNNGNNSSNSVQIPSEIRMRTVTTTV